MHAIVWEFTVPEQHRRAFENAYGSDGDWAVLFRTAPGYLGTELLQDETTAGLYLTIDRWEKPEDFANFKQVSGSSYDAMDRRFEELTTGEVKIGAFARPASLRG